jgi:hypothetical protein
MDLRLHQVYDRPVNRRREMTETNSGEVPTASLVGALAVFPLNDVLALLAETGQRGELQVVGHGVDGHLWIDGKDLVGATLAGANTLTQAVFELILLDEGWFYFTSDQVPPAGHVQHQSVSSVINEVVPQVQEWRDLLSRVPLDSEVSMAPTTPGPEVQIRADQWRVLTAVGTGGRTVSSVVEQLEDDNVVIVRLLRELADAGLIVILTKDNATPAPSVTPSATAGAPPGSASAPNDAAPVGTSSEDLFVDAAAAPRFRDRDHGTSSGRDPGRCRIACRRDAHRPSPRERRPVGPAWIELGDVGQRLRTAVLEADPEQLSQIRLWSSTRATA